MSDSEIQWWERYAAATPADQRRALYGRCCYDLASFLKDYAGGDRDVYALVDAADAHFRELLEATIGLMLNLAEQGEGTERRS